MVQRGEAQVASIEVVPCKSNQRSTGEPNSSSGLSQYCPSPWVGVAFGPLDGRGRSNLGHARNKRQHLLDGPRTVSASPRRVWRMTPETPQGQFVEPAPKPAETTARKAVNKRWYQAEIRLSSRPESPADEATAAIEPSGDERARLLAPAKVPSWRASSHDLATGLTVADFTDTVPGELYDQLFGDQA